MGVQYCTIHCVWAENSYKDNHWAIVTGLYFCVCTLSCKVWDAISNQLFKPWVQIFLNNRDAYRHIQNPGILHFPGIFLSSDIFPDRLVPVSAVLTGTQLYFILIQEAGEKRSWCSWSLPEIKPPMPCAGQESEREFLEHGTFHGNTKTPFILFYMFSVYEEHKGTPIQHPVANAWTTFKWMDADPEEYDYESLRKGNGQSIVDKCNPGNLSAPESLATHAAQPLRATLGTS